MPLIAISLITASLSLAAVRSVPVATIDSVGVPRSQVPLAARAAIDAFVAERKRTPNVHDPDRYRGREFYPRRYFLADVNGDGNRDVAVLYDLQYGQGDVLWLLFAIGPKFQHLTQAQVGTSGHFRCRYARFRGHSDERGFEFYTLYYEPNAPSCCPSVPGWSSFGYWAGDVVEMATTIEWQKRVPVGDPPPPPWR